MSETRLQLMGPTSADFLEKFINTIKNRTDMNLRNYEFSDEFRRTLDDMATTRMPFEFFDAIVNISIRLVSFGDETSDVHAFVDAVMRALTAFWGWFIVKFASKMFRLLILLCPTPFMKLIVTVLYILVDTFGERLWNEYIHPRMRRYVEFVTNKIQGSDETSG